jgi:signal transduction histidine kinase
VSGSRFDAATALCLLGLIYLAMPVMVWAVLRGRHAAARLGAWCGGAAACGGGCLLLALRGAIPDFWTVGIANLLALVSYPLSAAALRLEIARPLRGRHGLLFVGAGAALLVLAAAHSTGWRLLTGVLVQAAGTGWLAWTAAAVWRQSGSRSAQLIAGAFAAASLTLGWLALQLGLGGWPRLLDNPAGATQWVIVAGFVAGIHGSLGYLGMALERLRVQEIAQARRLAIESTLQVTAERHARRLRTGLDEREELLRLLAHEVRQPLNNATAALQAAHRALVPAPVDAGAASGRVQRAVGVLGRVVATLDHTLAATALLAGSGHAERRDVDVDGLVALVIGDLDPARQTRVRVDHRAGARNARLDAGLLRLALRNLLANALAYSPPGSEVLLRIGDGGEPPALMLEVCDHGPGIEAALARRLFTRGARAEGSVAGHGLGLVVVRRVAELHGGGVAHEPRPGGGSVFRLWLPQARPDASAASAAAYPALSSPRKT